jgi:hypothetical protein
MAIATANFGGGTPKVICLFRQVHTIPLVADITNDTPGFLVSAPNSDSLAYAANRKLGT